MTEPAGAYTISFPGAFSSGELNNEYGRLPKSSNTLNIRTLKIIAKYNFKMFHKISNSG